MFQEVPIVGEKQENNRYPMEKLKKEIIKIAQMTIETNLIQKPAEVEQIFLQAIDKPTVIKCLYNMHDFSVKGQVNFYSQIKISIFATATAIKMNLNHDELVLLARAVLVCENCPIYQKDTLLS